MPQFFFEPFHLDPTNARLWRGTHAISLTPKALAVLQYLVTHAGELVTKEALLAAIWPGITVGDAVLKVCMREIRKALGDSAQSPRFIATVHRRGYRFLPAVTPLADSRGEIAAPTLAPPEALGISLPQPALIHRPYTMAPSTHPVVARDHELARLYAWREQAYQGYRQVVFITGEAGIGKTAVVEAFLTQVASTGPVWIAHGQCVELYGAGEAYLPVFEALGQLCRRPSGQALVDLLRRQAPTWLAQMPWLLSPTDREILQRELLGATRERMLRELAEVVEALTAETPLVLVLEDLHWSDYATLDLVAMLAQRREPARLLLLGTYRPEEVVVSGHPLQMVKQALQMHGHCTELPLSLLDRTAVAEYLDIRFPASPLASTLGPMLHQHTDGNPLFMVNLVDHMVTQRTVVERAGNWELTVDPDTIDMSIPEGLQHMIAHQIELAAQEVQQLLEVACVAGVEFSTAPVAAVLNLSIEQIEAWCEELARQQLWLRPAGTVVWPDGTITGRYAFRHWFYQHVWYERLGMSRRVHVHQRLGECLATAYGVHGAEMAAELAMHFERGQDYERATPYLRFAAENAARRYANREAVGYLGRALGMADHFPPSAQVDLRITLLEQRGLIHRSMGEVREATRDFRALATEAQQHARPEVEADALFFQASVLSWVDRERCLAAVEHAMALQPRISDPSRRAHMRGWAGYWHLLWSGWRDADAQACAVAMATARHAGDRALLSLHLGQYTYFQSLQATYEQACQTAEEGSRLALEIGNASDYLLCQFFWAWALLHLGQWGEMWHLLQNGIHMAEKNGHHRWALLFRLELAWLSIQAGAYRAAEALCVQGLQQSQELDLAYGQVLGTILHGFAHLGLAQYASAWQCFQTIVRRFAHERTLMDWICRIPLHYGSSLYWLAQRNFAAAQEEAERLYAMAAQPGERTYMALGHQILAEIALSKRRWDEAETALTQAQAALAAGAAPLAEWRVCATAAQFHQQCGRLQEASHCWAHGAAVLSKLADSLGDVMELRQSLSADPTVASVFRKMQSVPQTASTRQSCKSRQLQ